MCTVDHREINLDHREIPLDHRKIPLDHCRFLLVQLTGSVEQMGEYKMQDYSSNCRQEALVKISRISPVLHLKINQLKSWFNIDYIFQVGIQFNKFCLLTCLCLKDNPSFRSLKNSGLTDQILMIDWINMIICNMTTIKTRKLGIVN